MSLRDLDSVSGRLNKMRKKSTSDLAIVMGILRKGSAFPGYSASTGNLPGHQRRGRQKRNTGHRFENVSPRYIQKQLHLGKKREVLFFNN
jgi:hypothetical protein